MTQWQTYQRQDTFLCWWNTPKNRTVLTQLTSLTAVYPSLIFPAVVHQAGPVGPVFNFLPPNSTTENQQPQETHHTSYPNKQISSEASHLLPHIVLDCLHIPLNILAEVPFNCDYIQTVLYPPTSILLALISISKQA